MMPTDKSAEAEIEHSNASAIHPFDRYMSEVYARKNDSSFSIDPLAQERAGAEPSGLSDNGEILPARSEKLRAEIIARAREAEEREREATERYKQIESKLRQEQALRRVAEQRMEEVEEEFRQRLAAAQAGDLTRLETELALAETKVRLKQESETLRMTETALSRLKEDARIQAQASSRALEEAENYIVELEARVNDLQPKATALDEAERRLAELEVRFREAQGKAAVTKSAEAAVAAADNRIAELEITLHDLKEKAAAAVPIALALEKAERRVAELEVGYREMDERAVAAESNALALEAELISTARNLGEKTAVVESTVIALEETRTRIVELEVELRDSEKKAFGASQSAREWELLARDAEASENEAQKTLEDAEARLQLEIEMRMTAEQKIQALENKFKSELAMDWTRFKADLEEAEAAVKAREQAITHTGSHTIPQTDAEEAVRQPDDLIQQLYTQLEEERQVRGELERKLVEFEARDDNEKTKFIFEAERRLAEKEAALKAANASRAEAERKLAEFVSGATELQEYFSAAGVNPSDPGSAVAAWKRSAPLGAARRPAKQEKITLVGYGAAAGGLFMLLLFLLYYGLKAL
jgi:chromosome segregation ATPase